jgi:ribosomal protein S27AE
MKDSRPKMKCPNCGADMNQHAEKIDYTAALRDPKAIDPVLGGIIEEFHTCPKCGISASRRGN